jgi:hypothetical protein
MAGLARAHYGMAAGSAVFLLICVYAIWAPRQRTRDDRPMSVRSYLLSLSLGSYAVAGLAVWTGGEAVLGRTRDGTGYGVMGIAGGLLFAYLGTRALIAQRRLDR